MKDTLQDALFWIDTVEKGRAIIELIQSPIARDRVNGLFELYPECKEFTHLKIAHLLGMTRESVSREMNTLGIYKRRKYV